MKIIIIKWMLLFILLTPSITSANNFIQAKIDGHLVRIIKYDRNDTRYELKIGLRKDYNAGSLKDIAEENNAISGINGVFLCPADYRECGGKNFTKNERYIKGKKIGMEAKTGDRVVFGWNKNLEAMLYQTNRLNGEREKDIYYGLANFPLILKDGESDLDYYKEKGLLDRKMILKGTRNFICSDETSRYFYMGFIYEASMKQMPDILKKVGCYNALNLDAGKTSALIYNGRQIIKEGRPMLDGVFIERRGFDVKKVNKSLNKVLDRVYNSLGKKYLDEKIETLEKIYARAVNMRTKIYDNYSTNLYDKKGNKNGYEIKLNNIKEFIKVYILNYVQDSIGIKIHELKKEKKELENIENLLF